MKKIIIMTIAIISIMFIPNFIKKVKAAYFEMEYKEIKTMTLTDGTQIPVPILKDGNYSQLVIDKRSEKEISINYYKNTVQYFKLTTNSVTEKNHYAYPSMDRYSIYYCPNTNTYNSLGCSTGYEAYENKLRSYNDNNNPVNYKEILYTDIEFRTNDGKTVVIEKTVLKPTISASHSNVGNDTYLNIEFSIFDASRYKYEYSLYDTKNWTEITSNNFLQKVYEDGTVFVRITNRETGEFVTSYSYLMTDVLNPVPEINFVKDDITLENGVTVSSTITISFSIFDRNRFIYEYAIDSSSEASFIPIKENNFKITTEQNCAIFVRIRNRETGEYIKSSTYNIVHVQKFVYDGKTYKNFIKIPLSEIYNSETGEWKTKQYVFLADKNDNLKPTIEFYFQLADKEGTTISKPVPMQIYLNKNILDIKEYAQKIIDSPTSDPDGYGGGFSVGGGSFGGGGGGGRFDDDEDTITSCTTLPQKTSIEMESFYHYATVTLSFNLCETLNSVKTPADFTTESIFIFYNGKKYVDIYEAIDDNLYADNLPTSQYDFLRSISKYVDFYSELINFSWLSLNSDIKNFIVASFSVIVICAIITIIRK